ncbi:MAG TPA: hypothetical protein VI916_07330 [Acidimicrobiia bacterium]|nr:hypothetical protein [Acidimicrobiia bacterium]
MSAPPTVDRVAPFLIDRAATMCPRRLRRHFQDIKGDGGFVARGRIRDVIVWAARAAHADGGTPNPDSFSVPDSLVPEEQALLRRANEHYLALFADDPLETIENDAFDAPVVADRGDFKVGGWIDLVGRRPDGDVELRQFELWGRTPSADPLESPTILLACLRIRKALTPERIRIRHADLIRGTLDEHTADLSGGPGEMAALFSRRLAMIRARTFKGEAVPGRDCTTCPFANGCPAFR